MLRLLADENFNGDIVRGLLLRQADLDIARVQDVGLAGADDPGVLRWAAENDRIIITHDRATMATYAFHRVTAADTMAGVLVINDRLPISQAIEEILLVAECGDSALWTGRVLYLPL